jgi:hypothetical protein
MRPSSRSLRLTVAQPSKVTILVNTSDHFDDCWEPFFKLFSSFWPNCPFPVWLNTERKVFEGVGLNVSCTQVQARTGNGRRLTWSECLLAALDLLTTPLVLYMQEDYFLDRPVDGDLIEQLCDLMLANPEIKHVGLTHFGSHGPFEPTADQRLWRISQRSKYRISTQAGLWRVPTLRSYLLPHENGWMFEIFGTRRAARRNECFLTLNRNLYSPGRDQAAIQYLHTGIIKGRWHPAIPRFFEQHGISVRYGERGMYKAPPLVVRKLNTAMHLLSKPYAVLRSLIAA